MLIAILPLFRDAGQLRMVLHCTQETSCYFSSSLPVLMVGNFFKISKEKRILCSKATGVYNRYTHTHTQLSFNKICLNFLGKMLGPLCQF